MCSSMSSCDGRPFAATAGTGLCGFAWCAGLAGAGVAGCAAGFAGWATGFAWCAAGLAACGFVAARAGADGAVAAGVAGATGCVTAGAGALAGEEPPPFIIVIAPNPRASSRPMAAKILIGVETCVSTDLLSAENGRALKE